MNLDTAIRLTAQVQGANNIRGLAQQFQGLTATSQVSGRQLDRLYTETKKLAAAAGGSINALRQQRTALVTLRDAVEPTSRRFQLLTRDVEALDRRLKALNGTQQQVANSQRGMARQAAGSALGTLATGGGVQGAVGALAGGLAFSGSAAGLAAGAGLTAVGAAGALAARVGVDAETAQVRLKALTDQFGEYNQAQAAAARIAGTLRISQIEASDGFSKLYAALRPTGVTLQEVEDAFVGFTAAAQVSGATAQESSAALIQLKQALGSGVLQGDELRSLREQAPLAAQAIAREMGVTIGELKDLGAEGKITTDIVLRALAKLKNENLGKLNQQFNTSAQAIKDLRIATEDLGRTIARVFGPTAVALVRGFAEAVKRLSDASVAFRPPTAETAADVIRSGRRPGTALSQSVFLQGAAELFKGSSGVEGVGLTGLRKEAEILARSRRQSFDKVLFELMQNRLGRIDNTSSTINSDQTDARAAATAEREAARRRAAEEAGKAARKEQEKAEKDAQKAAEQALERQINLQERLSDLRLRTEERIADLMQATNERALQMVQQINDEKLQGERRIKALQAETAGGYADIELNQQILRQRASGIDTSGLEARLQLNQARRQYDADIIGTVNEAKDRYQELTRRLNDFSNGFTDSLQGIFTQGAEQYRDAMQDAARDEEKAMRRLQSTGSRSAVTPRAAALLDTIAYAEGTWDSKAQSPRYNVGFGYNTFDNTRPHPGRVWRSGGYASAASGAFQFMPDTWRMINGGQNLPMNAANQDRAALGLISRRGVDPNAEFSRAIAARLSPEWASFPTMAGASYYGQPVKRFEDLQRFYQQRLGAYSATAAPIAQSLPAARPSSSYEVPGATGIASAASGLRGVIMGEANARSGNAAKDYLTRANQLLMESVGDVDGQIRSSREELENYQRQLSLIRGGLSPEVAQIRIETERRLASQKQILEQLKTSLEFSLQDNTLSSDTRAKFEGVLKTVQDRLALQPGIVDGLVAERVQLDELTRAYEDQKALVAGIAGSIGNGLSSSIDLLISGTESWGSSLREIASGVLQDIARQLAQMYIVQPATRGLQGLLGNLFGGGGSAGAAAAAGAGASAYTMPMLSGVPAFTGAFANGGVMTTQGPLPLRAYANGGIASSPQLALFGEGRMPEAYVPLPDGRRIPVAMQGGGGSNTVNVTVNAEGSQVQGDSGRSEQLGRVVAKAIQEELIRQRRPGGLLATA